MIGDVFKETLPRLDFTDNTGDVRPEMSWIILGSAPSGDTERLARVAASDAIHDSTPRAAVEGFKIRPNRRRIHSFVFHARCQDFAGVCFDVNIADRSSISNRQSETEFLPGNSGAEGENVECWGTCIHKV